MGWGLFATKDITRGSHICEYGGVEISEKEAEEIESSGHSEYLLEARGEKYTFFLNHTDETESYGKFINCSKIHPNLSVRIVCASGSNSVKFHAVKKIKSGKQLVYNYGNSYTGLDDCVDSCCGKKYGK